MSSKKRITNRIRFLNTYIDSLTAAEAKLVVDQYIQERGSRYVVTPNSDIIVKMQKDPELKNICDSADLILTDGQMLVALSHFLKAPIKERVCMTDFVWDVLDLAVEKGYRAFLLGGTEASLKQAVKNIRRQYPTLQLAGYHSPPPGFENNENLLNGINERIRTARPDILLVFLGCPKQEKFIYHNREFYQVPLSIPMGGCVDFIAGNVKRAPIWMQKCGLEWFYRFLQEPKRLFRRYFIDDVKIFGLTLQEIQMQNKNRK
ncbi:MAG: WecB/TagA/CpsF family glycosyltransferase [Lachnospiraceae bacterium]|nr:WecB/TagA/CpsF family glycosyltransferase [Lachnospiraceae bacterium]